MTYEQAKDILEKLDEGVDAEKSRRLLVDKIVILGAELYKNGDVLLRKGMDNALKIYNLYEGVSIWVY